MLSLSYTWSSYSFWFIAFACINCEFSSTRLNFQLGPARGRERESDQFTTTERMHPLCMRVYEYECLFVCLCTTRTYMYKRTRNKIQWNSSWRCWYNDKWMNLYFSYVESACNLILSLMKYTFDYIERSFN